jgi:hypothetical protein
MDNPIVIDAPLTESDVADQIGIVLSRLDDNVTEARDAIGELLGRYSNSLAGARRDGIDYLNEIDASLAQIMVALAGGFTFNFVNVTAHDEE